MGLNAITLMNARIAHMIAIKGRRAQIQMAPSLVIAQWAGVGMAKCAGLRVQHRRPAFRQRR